MCQRAIYRIEDKEPPPKRIALQYPSRVSSWIIGDDELRHEFNRREIVGIAERAVINRCNAAQQLQRFHFSARGGT
jgi:hypothetical protein